MEHVETTNTKNNNNFKNQGTFNYVQKRKVLSEKMINGRNYKQDTNELDFQSGSVTTSRKHRLPLWPPVFASAGPGLSCSRRNLGPRGHC